MHSSKETRLSMLSHFFLLSESLRVTCCSTLSRLTVELAGRSFLFLRKHERIEDVSYRNQYSVRQTAHAYVSQDAPAMPERTPRLRSSTSCSVSRDNRSCHRRRLFRRSRTTPRETAGFGRQIFPRNWRSEFLFFLSGCRSFFSSTLRTNVQTRKPDNLFRSGSARAGVHFNTRGTRKPCLSACRSKPRNPGLETNLWTLGAAYSQNGTLRIGRYRNEVQAKRSVTSNKPSK